MPLVASRSAREETPVGTYAARCIDVFDAGWWKNLDGQFVNKCKVVFYLGQDEVTGRDLYIDYFETLSLGKKANLTKHIEAWIGRALTADELKSFDLEKLVGAPALIQVTSKPKQDGTVKSIIGSIMKLPKGMTPPAAPEKYTPDAKREQPMASKFPKPVAKDAPAKAIDFEDVKTSLDLEDDDLPF